MCSKLLFLFLFTLCGSGLHAQAWGEVYLVNSIPINDQFSPEVSFRDLTDASFGIGVALSYSVNKLTVGLNSRYISYQSNLDGLEIESFRIGPTVDYIFFNEGRFYPYVGASLSMHQIKAVIDPSLADRSRQSNTYVGAGVRAGFILRIANRVGLHFGAEYSHINDFPQIDTTVGVAVDFGDF